ncbi:protocatechuate 3,4-dioxygenase subunit alpha [Pseudonocardiaceae bacterium YIM PH 21723]|nr:protocatechuate 3,4-dioxygenase subunit alpha [Pseudonocardiaceae bacterium YIM PH 21723]
MSTELGLTPAQTVGPYYSIGMTRPGTEFVVPADHPGAITISGRVLDVNGDPVPDATLEIWQADADGRFDHPDDPRGAVPGFSGFGRCGTDEDGRYEFRTVKPGALPDQAPHIDVLVFARGLMHWLATRIYFAEETSANAGDPVLASVDPDRRHTLIATEDLRFDIRLRGDGETVFFAL